MQRGRSDNYCRVAYHAYFNDGSIQVIKSMTGYACVRRKGEFGELTVDIRSVNHRFLDIKLNVPEALMPLESSIRGQLRTQVARGRVEVAIRWRAERSKELQINEVLANKLLQAAKKILKDEPGQTAPLDGIRLLAWPGVIEPREAAVDEVSDALRSAIDATIDQFNASRSREGDAMLVNFIDRLDRLDELLDQIGSGQKHRRRTLQDKLKEGLEALGGEVDSTRVAQEAALIIMRQDISEEMDRIAAHGQEMRRVLGGEGASGRRLDFLLQELLREANTMASKLSDVDGTRMAIDLKVLIEEMREQAQNVE